MVQNSILFAANCTKWRPSGAATSSSRPDETFLTDSRTGDVLMSASASNQRILLGVRSNAPSEIAVSAMSGVSVSRRLGVTGNQLGL